MYQYRNENFVLKLYKEAYKWDERDTGDKY